MITTKAFLMIILSIKKLPYIHASTKNAFLVQDWKDGERLRKEDRL